MTNNSGEDKFLRTRHHDES